MFDVKRVVVYPCFDASGRVTRKTKVKPKVRAIPCRLWCELTDLVATVEYLRFAVLVKLTFRNVSIQCWVECLLVVLALVFQCGWDAWVTIVLDLHPAPTWRLR